MLAAAWLYSSLAVTPWFRAEDVQNLLGAKANAPETVIKRLIHRFGTTDTSFHEDLAAMAKQVMVQGGSALSKDQLRRVFGGLERLGFLERESVGIRRGGVRYRLVGGPTAFARAMLERTADRESGREVFSRSFGGWPWGASVLNLKESVSDKEKELVEAALRLIVLTSAALSSIQHGSAVSDTIVVVGAAPGPMAPLKASQISNARLDSMTKSLKKANRALTYKLDGLGIRTRPAPGGFRRAEDLLRWER